MATKLFKIGESSYYGKWRLTIKGRAVYVVGTDWFTGKVEESKIFQFDTERRELDNYLQEVSTCYWAGQMMDWVYTKLKD